MINSLIWRLKEAWKILKGKKSSKTIQQKKVSLPEIKDFTKEEQDYIDSIEMEFIFAEFGKERQNAGGAILDSKNRLNPTLDSLRRFFPNAKYTVYSNFDLQVEGVELKRVEIPVPNPEHPRTGHRSSVYYRQKGLLNSEADFKCAIDSDMEIVSHDIISLIKLTEKFGFCVPYNSRQLLKQDAQMSLDTKPIDDDSKGYGRAYNQTPMTLWKNAKDGEKYYKKCCEIMAKTPARGSWVMWKAAWETGVHPYVLPKQFCVCAEDTGIGDEVILHIGHPQVSDYYNIK